MTRRAAVLTAIALLGGVIVVVVAVEVGLRRDDPFLAADFFAAWDQAVAARRGGDSSGQVCGFPADKEIFRTKDGEIRRTARCLYRMGYLSGEMLEAIQAQQAEADESAAFAKLRSPPLSPP